VATTLKIFEFEESHAAKTALAQLGPHQLPGREEDDETAKEIADLGTTAAMNWRWSPRRTDSDNPITQILQCGPPDEGDR
jgi:hypothetical protein